MAAATRAIPREISPSAVSSTARVERVRASDWRARGCPPLAAELRRAVAIALRGAVDASRCRAWVLGVKRARRHWNADFRGEQYALGRAFYTHYETGQSALYFRDAARSDARVERALPGMQASIRDLFARMTGASARPRRDFCGPGVHVFPAGENVARRGGVTHYDVEGLSPLHIERRSPALSLVVMLQPPAWGGGLRIWDATWHGAEEPDEADLARPFATHRYEAGEALLMESYRLHQIRPFRGALDRISITLHGVEVDRGQWDTWF